MRGLAILAAVAALGVCRAAAQASDLPAFVRADEPANEFLAARLQGTLALDGNGCLRVAGRSDDPGHFVIWHHDSRIERAEDGRIRIVDGFTGQVAHIGDEVVMAGGETTKTPTGYGTEAVPEACASGRFWVAGPLAEAAGRAALPVLVRRSERTFAAHQALIRGRLLLDDRGCLRIGNDDGPLVIWHHDSTIEHAEDGRIRITDGFTGNMAHVGDEIALGGSGGPDAPGNVTPPIPDACAGAEYWMAGDLFSEPQRLEMLERERNRVPVPLPSEAKKTSR